MPRSRVSLEQLLADLRHYHSYLLQDPCANPRALAYVEARIGSLASMNSHKSDCIDSGELAGLQRGYVQLWAQSLERLQEEGDCDYLMWLLQTFPALVESDAASERAI